MVKKEVCLRLPGIVLALFLFTSAGCSTFQFSGQPTHPDSVTEELQYGPPSSDLELRRPGLEETKFEIHLSTGLEQQEPSSTP